MISRQGENVIEKRMTSLSANQKSVLTSLIYILFVIGFTYLTVLNEKAVLYEQLDNQLKDAANITELLLPDALHHKDMAESDLNEKQQYSNILALSKFTDQRDIIYVYTLIQRGEQILFTSSSATPEERQSGEQLSFYFDHYDDVDPRVFDIFKSKETTFLEYTDQWGTFRSVFIPKTAPDGSFYLSVANLSISHIEAIINKLIVNSVLIAFLFLLFASPIYITATRKLKHDAIKLNQKVQRQTIELEDTQQKLLQNQSTLLELAKEDFQDKTNALTSIVNATAKQLDISQVSIWLFNEDKTAICRQIAYESGEISTTYQAVEAKEYPHYFNRLRNEGYISASDIMTHPATSELHDYLQNLGVTSMLDSPIYAEGNVIGVTCCEHTGPKRQWSKQDEEFARSISDLCAQVILNEQRKEAEQRLNQQAHYDELTKLPNRVLFADRFAQAVKHSDDNNTLLAICFIDLDNFKPVNDNYGHDAGDQLLIEVAKRLKEATRQTDTISRQGGDEFTLLLNDIESKTQCEQLLGRINKSLSQPYLIGDTHHKVSASIGATLHPNDEADLDTLLRHADQAMYQAKLSGKNRQCFFSLENDQEIVHHQQQLQEIQHALTQDQFELYYQPKVNMRTGKVIGAEALIRWLHPEKGIIPPLDFLPTIEGSELEIQLGDWVINQALHQLDSWSQQGIELEVSINISSHHLQHYQFFEQLTAALDAHPKVKSEQLQLEILESSALSDLSTISEIIDQCQNKLGVSVALDDFGTGYSALTHIRDLSADIIKMDRTFIRDILIDPSDYSIIDGIIGLANAFNLKIIAEGVECTEQGLMLMIMGCDEAQGYGISRPLPVEKFETWLDTYQPNRQWLEYGQQAEQFSIQDKQLKLLQLTTQHWYNNTLFLIEAGLPESKITACHLSVWFNRMKDDKLLSEHWLNKVKQRHDVLFDLGMEIIKQRQHTQDTSQNATLDELEAAYHDLNLLLLPSSEQGVRLTAIANH